MVRTRWVVVAVVATLSTLTVACDLGALDRLPATRSGARCRAEGTFARTATHVLQCRRGRFRAVTTLAVARQLISAHRPPPPPLTGPLRVLVVGDSFAMSLVPGLTRQGAAAGTITTVNAAMVGCGIGRGGLNRGIGLERPWPEPCPQRDDIIRRVIAEQRIEVVVVAGGMWDVTDRRLVGDAAWRSVGDPRYDLYLAGEILHLVDLVTASGARVLWTTSPHWNPSYMPTLFMGPPPYNEAIPSRADRLNELFRSALSLRPAVTLVDLAAHLQAMPGGEFGPGIRDDGVHLTDASSDQVAIWLAPQLTALATRPIP